MNNIRIRKIPGYSAHQVFLAGQVPIKDIFDEKGIPYKKAGKGYKLVEHQSVNFHDNVWMRFSVRIGGNALDLMIKYFEETPEVAMKYLLKHCVNIEINEPALSVLHKPEHADTLKDVYQYLVNERFINQNILSRFIQDGLIYEEAVYRSIVFVGKDVSGTPRHYAVHESSVEKKKARITLGGSDSRYSFNYLGNGDKLYAFEAPIDLLSFLSLRPIGWEYHSYVALCGLSSNAIVQICKENSNIKEVVLCLDRDKAGYQAIEEIQSTLYEEGIYSSIDQSKNKDWNEDLKELNCVPFIPGYIDENKELEAKYMKLIAADYSRSKKCKTFRDVLQGYADFQSHQGRSSLENARKLLITMAADCMKNIEQQTRQLGSKQDIVEIIKYVECVAVIPIKSDDHKELAAYLRYEIFDLKNTFFGSEYHTEEDKKRMIEDYKRCIKKCIKVLVVLEGVES